MREKQYEDTLDDLLDIVHSNTTNIIKIDEEKKFILLQRQRERFEWMHGGDMKLAEMEHRKVTLEVTDNKRK